MNEYNKPVRKVKNREFGEETALMYCTELWKFQMTAAMSFAGIISGRKNIECGKIRF